MTSRLSISLTHFAPPSAMSLAFSCSFRRTGKIALGQPLGRPRLGDALPMLVPLNDCARGWHSGKERLIVAVIPERLEATCVSVPDGEKKVGDVVSLVLLGVSDRPIAMLFDVLALFHALIIVYTKKACQGVGATFSKISEREVLS